MLQDKKDEIGGKGDGERQLPPLEMATREALSQDIDQAGKRHFQGKC